TRNDGQPVAQSCTPGHFQGCIAGRRQLKFSPHNVLVSRVDLRLSCLSVECPPDQTCDPRTSTCVPIPLCTGDDCTGADSRLDAGALPVKGSLSVSQGGVFTCARTASGGVRCWGMNGNGQLGDGTT